MSGCAALWAASSARSSAGSKGSMSLLRSAARRWRTRSEAPTPQDIANLSMRLQPGGAGDAEMDGERDAGLAQAVGPGDDRGGLEEELGGDRHRGVGLAGEAGLGDEGVERAGVAAVGIDVAVAFRVAGDVQAGEAAGVEAAGAQQVQRLVVGAARAWRCRRR